MENFQAVDRKASCPPTPTSASVKPSHAASLHRLNGGLGPIGWRIDTMRGRFRLAWVFFTELFDSDTGKTTVVLPVVTTFLPVIPTDLIGAER
jgi:hypothetical protein